jgi:hypothetical protein
MDLKELSGAKTIPMAIGTKKHAIPLRTSDEIRTMCVARTAWSIPKSFSGCNRTKDDIRIKRNESALKRRRLRKENMALRREIRQMERLLEMKER